MSDYQWSRKECETFAFKADDEGMGHAIGYAPDNDTDFDALVYHLTKAWNRVAEYAHAQLEAYDIEPDSDWTDYA